VRHDLYIERRIAPSFLAKKSPLECLRELQGWKAFSKLLLNLKVSDEIGDYAENLPVK